MGSGVVFFLLAVRDHADAGVVAEARTFQRLLDAFHGDVWIDDEAGVSAGCYSFEILSNGTTEAHSSLRS